MPASLSALNRGRRAAMADMRSVCRITRPSGVAPVWNDETLQYEVAPPVTVYEGRCKLRRTGQLQSKVAEVADQLFIQESWILHLPVEGTSEVGKDHTVEIIRSTTDPALTGRYKVTKAEAYDNPTSRRFTVESTQ